MFYVPYQVWWHSSSALDLFNYLSQMSQSLHSHISTSLAVQLLSENNQSKRSLIRHVVQVCLSLKPSRTSCLLTSALWGERTYYLEFCVSRDRTLWTLLWFDELFSHLCLSNLRLFFYYPSSFVFRSLVRGLLQFFLIALCTSWTCSLFWCGNHSWDRIFLPDKFFSRDVKCSGNWMWAAKLKGEGANVYDACVAMCDMLAQLGAAVDGGKVMIFFKFVIVIKSYYVLMVWSVWGEELLCCNTITQLVWYGSLLVLVPTIQMGSSASYLSHLLYLWKPSCDFIRRTIFDNLIFHPFHVNQC